MNKLLTVFESNINRPIRIPLKYTVVNSKEIGDTRGVHRSRKSKDRQHCGKTLQIEPHEHYQNMGLTRVPRKGRQFLFH